MICLGEAACDGCCGTGESLSLGKESHRKDVAYFGCLIGSSSFSEFIVCHVGSYTWRSKRQQGTENPVGPGAGSVVVLPPFCF